MDLNSNNFPDMKANDPRLKDPNRHADKRRGQLTSGDHVKLMADTRGTGLGEAKGSVLRPAHMKRAGEVGGLKRRPAVLPDQNPYLWVEQCLKVRCTGASRPIMKPLEVNKTVVPGLHLTYVCPHGTFGKGESCSACIADAEKRLFSIVSGRFKFMNESPAEHSINKVAWWSVAQGDLGGVITEAFVVDAPSTLRRKLLRKVEFKEETLLCVPQEQENMEHASPSGP